MTPSRIANKLRGECSYHTHIRVVLSTKKLGSKQQMEGEGGFSPCCQTIFLTLHIIFYFKTSFSKNLPFVNKKAYVLEILSILLNLKSVADFPRKMGTKHRGKFTILLCYRAVFLTLRIIFDFKTSFSNWQHWTDILSFSWVTVYKPCLRKPDANTKVSKPVWINYGWQHLAFVSDIVLKKTLKIPTLYSIFSTWNLVETKDKYMMKTKENLINFPGATSKVLFSLCKTKQNIVATNCGKCMQKIRQCHI
jgi:hypothetical protein